MRMRGEVRNLLNCGYHEVRPAGWVEMEVVVRLIWGFGSVYLGLILWPKKLAGMGYFGELVSFA